MTVPSSQVAQQTAPSRRRMSFRRRLVILWLLVAVSYAFLVVWTDPRMQFTVEEQHAIYDQITAIMVDKYGCHHDSGNMMGYVIDDVARENKMTSRAALVFARMGYRQNWGPFPCCDILTLECFNEMDRQ